VTGGKPIAVLSQSISGVSTINPLVAFYEMEEGGDCYSFILSQTSHETNLNNKQKKKKKFANAMEPEPESCEKCISSMTKYNEFSTPLHRISIPAYAIDQQ
jgi:hypothetical protein